MAEIQGGKVEKIISHDEARGAAQALVDHWFGNKTWRRVQTRIPAEDSDTDVLLMRYINQQAALKALPSRPAEQKSDYDKMMANWTNVCASDVFQELKHGIYRPVLNLLANGDISVGKACQVIAEIAHSGTCSELPNYGEGEWLSQETSWKDECERLKSTAEPRPSEQIIAKLTNALENLFALINGECPSILEGDHHYTMVTEALRAAKPESRR